MCNLIGTLSSCVSVAIFGKVATMNLVTQCHEYTLDCLYYYVHLYIACFDR